MTEKELMSYNSLLLMNENYTKKIEDLQSSEIPVVPGKVKGSSNKFPYTPIRSNVLLYHPQKVEERRNKIRELEKKRTENEGKIREIEQYIDNIHDPEIKMIAELRCLEQRSWADITGEMTVLDRKGEVIINKDRTTYSKKLKKHINKFP